MSLTAQERIKNLRVERGLTLKELSEQTGLSSSALGSYEADDTKNISRYALVKVATALICAMGIGWNHLLVIVSRSHAYHGFLEKALVPNCSNAYSINAFTA